MGEVVSMKNSMPTVHAVIYVLTKEEGGRTSPISAGYMPRVEANGRSISASLITPPPKIEGVFRLGQEFAVDLILAIEPQGWISVGDQLLWREGQKIVARGRVLAIKEP
jgi:translation elongation factor EF-Tu-like GTPase